MYIKLKSQDGKMASFASVSRSSVSTGPAHVSARAFAVVLAPTVESSALHSTSNRYRVLYLQLCRALIAYRTECRQAQGAHVPRRATAQCRARRTFMT